MDWDKVVNYGLPTVILAVIVAAGWRAAIWFRDKVAEPLMTSHLGLIETLKAEVPKSSAAMDEIRRELELQTEALKILPSICKHEDGCENFSPRKSKPKPA